MSLYFHIYFLTGHISSIKSLNSKKSLSEACISLHGARERAAEVMEMVRDLARHVRAWLDRTAEWVRDRMGPDRSELALTDGRGGRDPAAELTARLRGALDGFRRECDVLETGARDRDTERDRVAERDRGRDLDNGL